MFLSGSLGVCLLQSINKPEAPVQARAALDGALGSPKLRLAAPCLAVVRDSTTNKIVNPEACSAGRGRRKPMYVFDISCVRVCPDISRYITLHLYYYYRQATINSSVPAPHHAGWGIGPMHAPAITDGGQVWSSSR